LSLSARLDSRKCEVLGGWGVQTVNSGRVGVYLCNLPALAGCAGHIGVKAVLNPQRA